MKNKKKQVKRSIDLALEVVADLEPLEEETEAIVGGNAATLSKYNSCRV